MERRAPWKFHSQPFSGIILPIHIFNCLRSIPKMWNILSYSWIMPTIVCLFLPRSVKSDESKALSNEDLVDPAKLLKVWPQLMFLNSLRDVSNKQLAARHWLCHGAFLTVFWNNRFRCCHFSCTWIMTGPDDCTNWKRKEKEHVTKMEGKQFSSLRTRMFGNWKQVLCSGRPHLCRTATSCRLSSSLPQVHLFCMLDKNSIIPNEKYGICDIDCFNKFLSY